MNNLSGTLYSFIHLMLMEVENDKSASTNDTQTNTKSLYVHLI